MAEPQLTNNVNNWKMPLLFFFNDARLVFKMDSLGKEILRIAVPGALALAADPVASLIDTAFIGRIGAVELGAVGVAIAIFNQASKVTIFPLVNITTSFVAEEEAVGINSVSGSKDKESPEKISANETEVKELPPPPPPPGDSKQNVEGSSLNKIKAKDPGPKDRDLERGESVNGEKKKVQTENGMLSTATGLSSENLKARSKKEKQTIPSASTALIIGGILGLLQAIVLIFAAKPLLSIMGVKHDSPMRIPATKYLVLRSIGAPAVLLSLAMQGVFRGFKDTQTPLFATVIGDLTNIILDPIFIFVLRLGVSGAAIAHVLSQMMQRVNILPPNLKDLQFSKFIKNGSWLLIRVISVTICVTLAASMAARLGSTPMAAFQICLQIWLTTSLLADGLAMAGQAILAGAFAKKDYSKATAAATRVLQMSVILGLGLALVVGLGLRFGAGIFSKDVNVLHIIATAIPFVAGTQPINSISFVFDGVNFGASDYKYSAYSMASYFTIILVVAVITIGSLFMLFKSGGFIGIWVALTIYMALRTFAGVWRMGTGTGPWKFLRGKAMS
ncbi:hypothetical protein ACFE04_010220 [Oxalis oulophora]